MYQITLSLRKNRLEGVVDGIGSVDCEFLPYIINENEQMFLF